MTNIDLSSLRVQRSRRRGSKMPDDAIYVGRGSMWGNPFKLDVFTIMMETKAGWVPYTPKGGHTTKDVVRLFRDLLMNPNSHPVPSEVRLRFKLMRDRIEDLRGRRLACWCGPAAACHAEPLIELANS